MPKYELVAERQVVNTWNDAGTKIIKKVVYKKGDEIEMSEADAERYLASGGLRVPGQDDDEAISSDAPEPVGAGSTPSSPTPSTSPSGDLQPAVDAANGDGGDGEGNDDFDVDTADYPALQEAAKEREIPANQSADALRAAIKEHDADA